MAEDAARSGAEGDADPNPKGEPADAGQSGEADIDKIVAARVAQSLKKYGDLKEMARKAKAFEDAEAANQTEVDRLKAQVSAHEQEKANWEKERRSERLRSAVVREAALLGFRDPIDAFALLDVDDIEFDDAGEPKGLADKLGALSKDKPYLLGNRPTGSVDQGPQGKAAPAKLDMNALLRAAAKE